uniref:50S ribosomal protein L29 n=1 Tax=Dictyotopsis propagulifera TaxID=670095 RepID=UPI002E7AA63C|nr:50S ribosomal protein L29 [Dictyotopsis propagulifera]WAM63147.1 50S ribosomal protein L29 [Dictyotopsis propagulifera]
MILPKIEHIQNLSSLEIENEILTIKKQLFKLRFCRSTKETFKSHEFKHKKHRLAQLLLKKKRIRKKRK